jgi:hypothetical protein
MALALELPVEELHGALPGQLRRLRVVLERRQLALVRFLVGEGVLRLVAVELELRVAGFQLLLQLVDLVDGEELVLGGAVTEERRVALRSVDVLERRKAVPGDAGVRPGRRRRRS